jgi:saccharopine dehydrogenase-like NADP-dependent oxidoreductase
MKILIIGGYGRFGGNLAKLLSDCEGLTLLIAGRNLDKANALCQTYDGLAEVKPLLCDRNEILPILERETPDVVVDASGPFQIYGEDPYHVAKACIALRIDYLDLADGADFVTHIDQLNDLALANNVCVISGLSTCPALSGAIVRAIGSDLSLTDITLGIAPSPKAELGLSVIKAILSYVGTKIPTRRNGEDTDFIGLAESRNYQIAIEDYPPLERRRFSAVEAPELRLFPKHYPTLKTVWVGAGTRPEYLLRLLNGLAWAKAKFNLPSLTPLSKIAHHALRLCQFGPHRGGMFVEVKGLKKGQPVSRQWHLIAEGDDGPLIPAIAAEIVIRKRLEGNTLPPGARAATNTLTLQDFEARFERHKIITTAIEDMA